jgi:hypothetical protein
MGPMAAVLIAVLCAVLQSASPSPAKTSATSAHSRAAPPKTFNSQNAGETDARSESKKPADEEVVTKLQESPTLQLQTGWRDGVYWILELMLVLVAGGSFVAVWYQAQETARVVKVTQLSTDTVQRQISIMERQTKAAEDAAAAALLNARAVMHSERPWIIVTIEPHPNFRGSFLFAATNKGRTPAQLISGSSEYTFAARPQELPVPPNYSSQFTGVDETLLVPGDPFQIYSRSGISPEDILARRSSSHELRSYNETLVFYGRIVYRDGFGKDGDANSYHETRWCFAYLKSERRFIATGPDEYNRHT